MSGENFALKRREGRKGKKRGRRGEGRKGRGEGLREGESRGETQKVIK